MQSLYPKHCTDRRKTEQQAAGRPAQVRHGPWAIVLLTEAEQGKNKMDPRGPPYRRHAPVELMRSDLIHPSRLTLPHAHERGPYLIMAISGSSVSPIIGRKDKGTAADVQ